MMKASLERRSRFISGLLAGLLVTVPSLAADLQPSAIAEVERLIASKALATRAPLPDAANVQLVFGKDFAWTGAAGEQRVILWGDPTRAGPYGVLYNWGAGHFSKPHSHSMDRYAYVVAGTWWKSTSTTGDPASAYPIPAGSYVHDVAGKVHWDGAKDEPCLVLVTGVGPVTTDYVASGAPAASGSRIGPQNPTPGLKAPDAPMLPYRFVAKPAAPPGQRLGNVSAVALTPAGHLLVLNRNPQIMMLEYDAAGRFLRTFNPNIAVNTHGMRVDRHGNIWVIDSFLNVIWKLSPAGEPLMVLGKRGAVGPWTEGEWNGLFNQPLDMAFDSDDNLYVVQGHGGTSNPPACALCATYETVKLPVPQGSDARLLKLDPTGKLLASRSFDDGTGSYPTIHSVIVTPRGEVWVTDRQRNRIVVLDRQLQLLKEVQEPARTSGLFVDARGQIWLSSGMDGMVMQLDGDGRITGWIGKAGRSDDPESDLIGEAHYLAVTPDQRTIYVADSVNAKVLKLQRR